MNEQDAKAKLATIRRETVEECAKAVRSEMERKYQQAADQKSGSLNSGNLLAALECDIRQRAFADAAILNDAAIRALNESAAAQDNKAGAALISSADFKARSSASLPNTSGPAPAAPPTESADEQALMDAKLRGISEHLRAAYPLLQADADVIDDARRRLRAEQGKQEPVESMLYLGGTYETQGGELVKMVWIENIGTPYETLVDEAGVNRYSRRVSDAGRCTGSAHDYSNPKNIKRPFAAKALNQINLYAAPTPDALLAAELAGMEKAERFLCYGAGETQLPVVRLVTTREGVEQFLIDEFVGDKNDDSLPDFMSDFDAHDWSEPLHWSFEIGYIEITKVWVSNRAEITRREGK